MAPIDDMYKAHREAADKYTYFLLAAAGAAIGFSMSQTQQAILSWWKVPLGLAILFWAFSFFSGCQQLRQANNLLQRNYRYLVVKSGQDPVFPDRPDVLAFIEKDLRDRSEQSGKWQWRQFTTLVAGGGFYIAWHIVEMFLRTKALH